MKSKNTRRSLSRAGFQSNPSVAPGQSKTALKESKLALKKSNDRFRSLVEMTSDWIWEVDAHSVYTYVSPKVTDLLGYTVEEVLGKTPFDLMPSEESKRISALVKPMIGNARPIHNLENTNIHKYGHPVILETNGVPVFNISGNLVGYRGIDRDITERKRMEEVLRESEEKYRSLLDHAYDAIMIAEFDGHILEINEKAEQLMGYTKEELLDSNISRLHPEEERERALRAFREMREGTIHVLFDTKVLKKDGTSVSVDISGGVIAFGGKKVVQGICRDITVRKDMEEALAKSEHRFRSLSEASLEAIVFIEDGIIVDANQALNRLFGYEGEDLRGKLATNFIVPEKRPFTDERMRTRTVGAYETFGLRKDGSTFPIEVNAREFEYDGTRLRISAVRDLTEYKKIEKQLKDYQEHLENLVDERTRELRASEEKYRDIFENAQEGIFQSTPDGRLISANPALASMFGSETTEELIELVSDRPGQLYADPSKRQDFIDAIAKDGVVRNFDFQVCRKDGLIKYASINARALHDQYGRILYYEGTVQDVTEKKEVAHALEAQRQSLEEANIALKVLLKHREEDRKSLEKKFLANVKQLVVPYIEKLKKSALDQVQKMNIELVESNLNELISPFLHGIQGFNLTPRQLEVSTLIREGRTTKDIARILNMSKDAVDIQRFLIRKKLGLNKAKTNLQAYLKSLS